MYKLVISLVFVLIASGCSSVSKRIIENDIPPRTSYEATKNDWQIAGMAFYECSGPECGFLRNSMFIRVPATIVGIISLPVSALVDTIMLPIDLHEIKNKESK